MPANSSGEFHSGQGKWVIGWQRGKNKKKVSTIQYFISVFKNWSKNMEKYLHLLYLSGSYMDIKFFLYLKIFHSKISLRMWFFFSDVESKWGASREFITCRIQWHICLSRLKTRLQSNGQLYTSGLKRSLLSKRPSRQRWLGSGPGFVINLIVTVGFPYQNLRCLLHKISAPKTNFNVEIL